MILTKNSEVSNQASLEYIESSEHNVGFSFQKKRNNKRIVNMNLPESANSSQSKKNKNSDAFIKFRIQVTDTGVGIKKENLSKLFIDFGKLNEHSKINL